MDTYIIARYNFIRSWYIFLHRVTLKNMKDNIFTSHVLVTSNKQRKAPSTHSLGWIFEVMHFWRTCRILGALWNRVIAPQSWMCGGGGRKVHYTVRRAVRRPQHPASHSSLTDKYNNGITYPELYVAGVFIFSSSRTFLLTGHQHFVQVNTQILI